MGLQKTIAKATRTLVGCRLSIRDASVMPSADMLRPTTAVRLTAVFLCAGLVGAGELPLRHPPEAAVKPCRRACSGQLRRRAPRPGRPPGQRRVHRGRAADRSVRAALDLKWVLDKVVSAEVCDRLLPLRATGWVLRHRAGLDTGQVIAIRGGVRSRSAAG